MLNNISWTSYAHAVSISVIIYYIFVFLLFYRRELQHIISQNNKVRYHASTAKPSSKQEEVGTGINYRKNAAGDESMPLPELFILLQNLINIGNSKDYPKEEILLSIKLALQQYPFVKAVDQQEKINQYILTAFESISTIHLSGEVISALWRK